VQLNPVESPALQKALPCECRLLSFSPLHDSADRSYPPLALLVQRRLGRPAHSYGQSIFVARQRFEWSGVALCVTAHSCRAVWIGFGGGPDQPASPFVIDGRELDDTHTNAAPLRLPGANVPLHGSEERVARRATPDAMKGARPAKKISARPGNGSPRATSFSLVPLRDSGLVRERVPAAVVDGSEFLVGIVFIEKGARAIVDRFARYRGVVGVHHAVHEPDAEPAGDEACLRIESVSQSSADGKEGPRRSAPGKFRRGIRVAYGKSLDGRVSSRNGPVGGSGKVTGVSPGGPVDIQAYYRGKLAGTIAVTVVP
jgi:hypothetical protein